MCALFYFAIKAYILRNVKHAPFQKGWLLAAARALRDTRSVCVLSGSSPEARALRDTRSVFVLSSCPPGECHVKHAPKKITECHAHLLKHCACHVKHAPRHWDPRRGGTSGVFFCFVFLRMSRTFAVFDRSEPPCFS